MRGVSKDMSDEELKENIEIIDCGKHICVVSVQRLMRKVVKDDKSVSRVPTESVVITVRGVELPKFLSIHKVIYRIDPFVPRTIQCYNCCSRQVRIQFFCPFDPETRKEFELSRGNSKDLPKTMDVINFVRQRKLVLKMSQDIQGVPSRSGSSSNSRQFPTRERCIFPCS